MSALLFITTVEATLNNSCNCTIVQQLTLLPNDRVLFKSSSFMFTIKVANISYTLPIFSFQAICPQSTNDYENMYSEAMGNGRFQSIYNQLARKLNAQLSANLTVELGLIGNDPLTIYILTPTEAPSTSPSNNIFCCTNYIGFLLSSIFLLLYYPLYVIYNYYYCFHDFLLGMVFIYLKEFSIMASEY